MESADKTHTHTYTHAASARDSHECILQGGEGLTRSQCHLPREGSFVCLFLGTGAWPWRHVAMAGSQHQGCGTHSGLCACSHRSCSPGTAPLLPQQRVPRGSTAVPDTPKHCCET